MNNEHKLTEREQFDASPHLPTLPFIQIRVLTMWLPSLRMQKTRGTEYLTTVKFTINNQALLSIN